MSLNVTYDQCYYGIVKMRDETEARIPSSHPPISYPSCSSGAGTCPKRCMRREGTNSDDLSKVN